MSLQYTNHMQECMEQQGTSKDSSKLKTYRSEKGGRVNSTDISWDLWCRNHMGFNG